VPFSHLEIVAKQILEVKNFTVLKIRLFQTALPFINQLCTEFLSECSRHCDIPSSNQNIALHGIVFAI